MRGRRLNRLTNEPCIILSYTILFVKYFFHIFIFIFPELEELAFDLGDIVPSFIVLASFLLFLYFCKCLIKWLEYLVKLRSILWILLCDFSTLFFDVARIIRAKKPAIFVLENVKNLKSHDKGKTFKVIMDTLDELGYEVADAAEMGKNDPKVIDGKHFLPQHRERTVTD